MYYHSGNLQRELARFRILALRPNGEIRASIFARTYNRDAEIFGVFADEGYEDAKAVLVQELLNHLHEEMGALTRSFSYRGRGHSGTERSTQRRL
jgi:hypothetical protein